MTQSLDELRTQINALDDQILRLLEERAQLVDGVAREKRNAGAASFHDPKRERDVLDRLVTKGAGQFPPDAIRVVFREIMSACLSLQEPARVCYLGPEGTFTQMAAHQLFGLAARYMESVTIDGVFDAVQRGVAAYGVAPIENANQGSVALTMDALIGGDLLLCQEHILPIEHCLLSHAKTLTEIKTVYSHPQALAQCRVWLAKYLPAAHVIQTVSTAAAAQEAASEPTASALGSRLSSEHHRLPIVRESVQDHENNATRFVVLAKHDAPRTGDDKTTLAFAFLDGAGSLRRTLEAFESEGINLSRIESRPAPLKAWEYVFLCDLFGHRTDASVAAAIEKLTARCTFVKMLGSYPRAPSVLEAKTAK